MKKIFVMTVTFLMLFGGRIGLEWLAEKYEFFGQWLTIATVALIAVSIALALTIVTYIAEQCMHLKDLFTPSASEQEQGVPKRIKVRGEARAEKREERARRAQQRQNERDKIYRLEAFEKRLKKEEKNHEREEKNKNKVVCDEQK